MREAFRLFTAIELPEAVADALAALQPPRGRGIRPVARERMHLTLHFIGDADPAHAAAALERVRGEPFELTIGALGMFSRRGRPAALWAGVDHEDRLHALYAAIGEALEAAGYALEARPYRPHVTLARVAPDAGRAAVKAFLAGAAIEPLHFPVNDFVLYSSEPADTGHVYTVRARYGLE